MKPLPPGIASALAAALLFGVNTRLAKQLLADMAAQMLAGLLYLGSGLGTILIAGIKGLAAGSSNVALDWPSDGRGRPPPWWR